MSLAYNGTTSIVTSDATQTLGDLLTYFCWMKPTSSGEGTRGHLVDHGTGTGDTGGNPVRGILYLHEGAGTDGAFRFVAGWSVADGRWRSPTATWVTGVWQSLAVTYDYGNTANAPVLYYNGVSVAVTTIGAPSGSAKSDNQLLYIGNNDGTDRTFDGLIGEVAIWKRILSAAEIAAVHTLGVNACPDRFNYLPHDGGIAQNLGSSGTTFTPTATTTGENPPIRPAGRRG